MREIIIYKNHFFSFYEKREPKVKKKIDFVLKLVSTVNMVPIKYFKQLTGTPKLYEVRVLADTNQYRIFCFLDSPNKLVLLNGFQKKMRKTPIEALQLAIKLKKMYHEET